MRAARLISLVLLLQVRGSMTAAELAERLEVSERTVGRDVDALSAAGIPVYADRGRAGGYRLVDGYRTRLTGLTRAEAEALFLSGAPGPVAAMGLGEQAGAARLKVLAALPPGLRDTSERAAQRFHLAARWFARDFEPPPALAPLAHAVWNDLPVTATYHRSGDGGTVERRLEPYGLVWKGGTWYAVASPAAPTSTAPAEPRVYRVDQFGSVEPGAESFARDPEFDLPAFWTERADAFARSLLSTEIELLVTEAGLAGLGLTFDPVAATDARATVGEPGPDGRRRVRIGVESFRIALSQVLHLGADAEVVAPTSFRTEVAAAARALAARYA